MTKATMVLMLLMVLAAVAIAALGGSLHEYRIG